jgi:phosphatidylglycerophosphate synthase
MATSILYDKVLSPFYDVLAARLFPDFVHPNVITLMGGGCASLALIAIRAEAYGYAAALFICYSSLDNMDGKHARRTNQCSRLGAFLDHGIDGSIGLLAGYEAVSGAVFGLAPSMYWRGYHATSCVWLAPHVVALFTGKLDLGTRLLSVDEAFLGTSLTLALASVQGAPLLDGSAPIFGGLERCDALFAAFYAISAAYVVATALLGFGVGEPASSRAAKPPAAAAPPRLSGGTRWALTLAYAAFWSAPWPNGPGLHSLMPFGWPVLMCTMLAAGLL